MFEVYLGCEEWQEVDKFTSIEEARAYVEEQREYGFTNGLYTADEGWIKNDAIDFYEEIDL